MFLTIFTPAYNRAHLLPRLYESLKAQTLKDFEWVIVDDGSTDDTEPLIRGYMASETSFPIRYAKQPNGGKHRAINRGVSMATGAWFFIVDSDDWLAKDAVEKLWNETRNIENDARFCAYTGLKVYNDGRTVGTQCDGQTIDCDFFTYRYKLRIWGDRAEVVKTDVMREFPFPEFEKEKFLTESAVWFPMSEKYLSRYSSVPIYYCEYQPDGLSANNKKLLSANPIGFLYFLKRLIGHPKCSFKNEILHLTYYRQYEAIAKQNGCTIPEECRLSFSQRLIMTIFAPMATIYMKLRQDS